MPTMHVSGERVATGASGSPSADRTATSLGTATLRRDCFALPRASSNLADPERTRVTCSCEKER